MQLATGNSDRTQDLLERIDTLSKERLAPRAARYDREASHPKENWDDLWREGCLGLLIPEQYGGLDVDPLTYASVLERIAQACASTAMTINMHSLTAKIIATLGTPRQQARYFDQVVQHRKLLTAWSSESRISLTRTYLVETSVRPVDGGFLVNGAKHFCTMAGAASYYLVLCFLEGEADMAHAALYTVIESDNPGVEIVGEWDTLGMRATVSPGSRFTNCFVGKDDVLGEPGEIIGSGIFDFFGIGHAAVYLGIAQGAFNVTADYCRTTTFRPSTAPLATDPMIQRHMGEMAIRLEAARLLLQRAAVEWPTGSAERRAELSAQAKHTTGEAGIAVTSHCLQVCGGRSALKSMPVERAYRDIRTATLMPPNADTMLGAIGRGALGLGGEGFRFG